MRMTVVIFIFFGVFLSLCQPAHSRSLVKRSPIVEIAADVKRSGDQFVVDHLWFSRKKNGLLKDGDPIRFSMGSCDVDAISSVLLVKDKDELLCVSSRDGRHPRYWFDARTLDELLEREKMRGEYGALLEAKRREAAAQSKRLRDEIEVRLNASICGRLGDDSYVVLWPDGRRNLFSSRYNYIDDYVDPKVDELCVEDVLSQWRGQPFDGEFMVWSLMRDKDSWRVGAAYDKSNFLLKFDLPNHGSVVYPLMLSFIYSYRRELVEGDKRRTLFGHPIYEGTRKKRPRKWCPLATKEEMSAETGVSGEQLGIWVGCHVETRARELSVALPVDEPEERALVCLFHGLDVLRRGDAPQEELAMCALRESPAQALALVDGTARPSHPASHPLMRALVRALARWDGVDDTSLLAAWRAEHPLGRELELYSMLRSCESRHHACAVSPQAIHAMALLWVRLAPGMRAEAQALLYAAALMTDDAAMKARLHKASAALDAGAPAAQRALVTRYVAPWQRKLSDAEAMEVKLKRAERQRAELSARQATEADAARAAAQRAMQGATVIAARQAREPAAQAAPAPAGVRDALIVAVALAALALVALLIRSANRR